MPKFKSWLAGVRARIREYLRMSEIRDSPWLFCTLAAARFISAAVDSCDLDRVSEIKTPIEQLTFDNLNAKNI